jgi:hypothetical protein
MKWLDRPISPRGELLIACCVLGGGVGIILGPRVSMSFWEVLWFSVIIAGGVFGVADSVAKIITRAP